MNTYQAGERTRSPNLVRLNVFFQRHQTPRLVSLAESISRVKGRGVRLGEALELVLEYVARVDNSHLLRYLKADHECKDWVDIAPVHREPKVLIPQLLRPAPAKGF